MAGSNQFSEEQLMELQRQIEALRKELNAGDDEFATDEEGSTENASGFNGSVLTVAEDLMAAWLILRPPAEGEQYSVEEITRFLEKNNVITGLHTSNISAMVRKRIYNKEVKIAAGRQETQGQDGYYEYYFSPEQLKGPSIRPNGTVDYSSMGLLQNVAKGDIVAVYHRAVQGIPGYKVDGEEMKCVPARELAPIRGRNIRRLEDGITYVSEVDGKVEVKDGRVDVQNVHEIHDDVTYINGKVEFYGDIVIYGNVESGVILRAGRNVTIKGITEAVTIYAGGDVVMEKGLVGGKKAKVSVRGNVFADFVENAAIEAKGDVNANIIMNSSVSCNGRVILTGQRGALVGGYTHGLMGVEAVSMGNEVEVKTIVHAGFDSKTYLKHLEIYKKTQETNQILEQTVEEMSDILKKKQNGKVRLTRDEEIRLKELNDRKDECFASLDDLKTDRNILEDIMGRGKGAEIICKGPINRGVIVCVDNAQLPIDRSTCYMRYHNNGGVIDGNVIVI